MNLDSLSFALSQISYSVANLTKKNFKSNIAEISNLVAQYKSEAYRHLIRCLFSHVDFSGDNRTSGKDLHQTQYLIQECEKLIGKPNFVSIFCYAIENPLHQQKSLRASPHLFSQLSKVLKFTCVQEVAFGLAAVKSESQEIRKYATQFVKQKLPQLLSSYTESGTSACEVGLRDAPIEVIHLILSRLASPSDCEAFGVLVELKEKFVKALSRDFPREVVPVVLSSLIYPEIPDFPLNRLIQDSDIMSANMMAPSLADMVMEMGCGFTKGVEQCRSTLMQVGTKALTPASVARVIGMMIRCPTVFSEHLPLQNPSSGWVDLKDNSEPGKASSWNPEVFVKVVKEMVPSLSWTEVVKELDHSAFLVSGKQSLELLMQSLILGLGGSNFPIEVLFKLWKNKEGLLSWITCAVKNNDVFCLADYPYRATTLDSLKSLPDDENRDIAIWKSLDLIEILLQLSDEGLYSNVMELFTFHPVAHCPDLLLLGLLQLPRWNMVKRELVLSLIPIFLGNHPNSVAVLQFAWHCQSQSTPIRTLMLQAMADWYMREVHEQTRLSRVLDVAQDLKALSILLNGSPFAFVIDLACLASRREYLKLDKWLTDKIREHREPFVQACVDFLVSRCPQLVGKDEQIVSQNKSQQLQAETVTIMLSCLQNCVQTGVMSISPELQENIHSLTNNAAILMNTKKPAMPGVGAIPGIVPRGGISATLPGLQGTMGNPMDPLASAVAMAAANPGVNVSAMNSQYPAGLSGLGGPPGSPAKNFSQLGQSLGPVAQAQNASYNSMQALTSQLQGLNLQSALSSNLVASLGSGIGTGLGTGFGPGLGGSGLTMVNRGAPSLSALSTQVALSQQQQQQQQGLGRPVPQTSDLATMFPNQTPTQQFTKEVEDEANSYFQRIYNNAPNSALPPMSVEQALELLKSFRDSPSDREKEVFQCMLRNLFEEYRFFSQYPDKELQTTAVLFGGIIEQGLVTYMALGMALRSVLEALRKPQGSKMFLFGLTALDRFKTRLREYPQYCQFLVSIPHFADFPPILKEYIEYGGRSMDPPHASVAAAAVVISSAASVQNVIAPAAPPAAATAAPGAAVPTTQAATQSAHGIISRPTTSAAPSRTSIASATNIDTLLANKEGIDGIDVPPEILQDKVFFIFNNLSQSNMDQKAAELREAVGDEFLPWVAQYLVMKRASIEHNFHVLYGMFIDQLKKPEFLKLVIRETYRNIKVLLRSDKVAANFSDRTLLKNLGHWLGMLTLAKNKPVLYIDIDLKSLLYEAYHMGSPELLYVVPFVAKIIESAQRSRVFKPPNPWTMAIMNVLGELHMEHDLRLNLKFEIEVLCKNLSLDVNDLVPGNYLKDLSRLNKLEHQLSPPSSKPKDSSTPQPDEPLQINMPTPTTTMMTQVISNPAAISNAAAALSTAAPLQPQYGYNEINLNFSNLSNHIIINDQITLFQAHPQLKQCVRPAIERAVQEMMVPAVERAIKIALTTSEQIVKKDFALDPDDNHLRTAAHNLARFMTAGMALIMCHEPVHVSISTQLKTFFLTALRGASQQQKDMIEQAASVVAADNTELATVFLQKTAVEKALPEMDKRLNPDYEARKMARNEGRRYYDTTVLKYQMDRMPEEIRLKQGGFGSHQLTIYDEFASSIPGFLPTTTVDGNLQALPYMMKSAQQFGAEEMVQVYDKVGRDIEQHFVQFVSSPLMNSMRTLLEYILLVRNSVRDINAALALLQRAVEGMLEGMMLTHGDPETMARYRDSHLVVLKTLQDPRVYGPQWTNKQVTRCLIECRDELRYSIDAVDCLIRNQLVVVQQYDLHLAQLVENNVSQMLVAFVMQLIQRFCLDTDRSGQGVQEGEFNSTVEALSRLALHSRQLPEGLTSLLDAVRQRNGDLGLHDRASLGPASVMHSGINQAREFDDPPGLHDKTEFLLREWVNLYHAPSAGRDSGKAFNTFVAQMHFHGILKTDDMISRFFRLCTEMCVDLCYRALSEQTQSVTRVRVQCFHTLDAFVRLTVLLLKHSGDVTNTQTKINLLNKVLGIVAGILLQDHEVRRVEFQQLPYHRIFIMLFIELNNPEPILENINFEVLQAFCNILHLLRPTKAPGFAYAWLELVSHRVFIGRMLAANAPHRTWGMYAQLLIDLFTFLSPFLRNADLSKSLQLLYKGTMRVLLVMLHDFPDFLCEYHYAFCDIIPPNCIQVRNLILSAFPRSMRLPDPFTPNLKVDILPEIAIAPRIVTNFSNMIQPPSLKKDLDSYLLTRSPVTFLSELRSKLQVSNVGGLKYNIPLMNSIVLHVGTQAIQQIQKKGHTPNMSTIAHSSHMDIFQNLAVDLDTEGRYLFLNAMANQLRYPNSHTHYFSCTLLYLFAEANTEAIQEQITRVLLERLIVNRPHPWGLLVTFIELIKNPQFKFWNHEFVRCAPEIEKLLESVARSCMPPKSTMRDQDGQELR